MNKCSFVFLLSSLMLLTTCKTTHQNMQSQQESNFSQSPAPIMVYKTRNDYSKLVPIVLSPNKDSVLNYPHPQDLKQGNSFRYPVLLEEGYLLDRKGIQAGTAFLKITYEEYVELNELPSPDQLLEMIADADPFTELYRCRINLADNKRIDTLNAWIRNRQLEKRCSKLK
ncbi:MAG TPA: hypothetical protein PKU86_03530 [Bacteroidales bacterium]|nr:hypothetical protein [Bacteroidales bacterium]